MPSLQRVVLQEKVEGAIWQANGNVGVSGNGRVAIPGDFGLRPERQLLLHIFSANSDSMLSVGRRGQGPGELSGTDIVFGRGSAFDVYNLRRLSLLSYTDGGKYLGEDRLDIGQRSLLAVSADSVDALSLRWDPSKVESLVLRYPRKGGLPRTLVLSSDTFVVRTLQRPDLPGRAKGLLAYAAKDGQFAIGDGMKYRIVLYGNNGATVGVIQRELPPNRRSFADIAKLKKELEAGIREVQGRPDLAEPLRTRLDTLSRESLPHFYWPGVQFDGSGRLWVIGGRGDSTFADVFSGSRFLGRRMLPCRRPERRIAVQGDWLALVCEKPQREEAPFELQLYYFGQGKGKLGK